MKTRLLIIIGIVIIICVIGIISLVAIGQIDSREMQDIFIHNEQGDLVEIVKLPIDTDIETSPKPGDKYYIEPERRAELVAVEQDLRSKIRQLHQNYPLGGYAVNLDHLTKEIIVIVETEQFNSEIEYMISLYPDDIPIVFSSGKFGFIDEFKPEPSDFYPRYNVSIFHNAKTMGQYMTNDFITIGPYSHVTWANYDDVSVTINSKGSDEKWGTDVILPQGYATVTFNKTGIYEYTGDYGLNGVIIVMDDGGELLSSKFSDVFRNGSPLMYTEGMEPVLLYDNCKRYAYWLNEQGKEKIDLYEDYPRYPPWGNQIFPLVDFCVTNGDLVKTISGDHYRWEFQLENEN